MANFEILVLITTKALYSGWLWLNIHGLTIPISFDVFCARNELLVYSVLFLFSFLLFQRIKIVEMQPRLQQQSVVHCCSNLSLRGLDGKEASNQFMLTLG